MVGYKNYSWAYLCMAELESIIHAAKSAGKVITDHFGNTLQTEQKSIAADFYTQADLDSEREVLKVLKKAFPKRSIFSEESGIIDRKSEYTFFVDPLDGSNNFVLGIPNFSVSIGLAMGNKLVAGVIHCPILNKTYYAQRGKGAFVNGSRLRVNDISDITKASVAYSCAYKNSEKYEQKLIRSLRKGNVKRLMQNWSPAYDFCMLAAGRIECVISNENDIYDYCAGKLIAKEAGAKITDFVGKPEKDEKADTFLATNGTELHDKFLKVV